MAGPDATTAITLAKIRDEIENNNYNNSIYGYTSAATSLTSLSNGTYATINTQNASADRPDGSAPHAMSEFFSYDHDKQAAFSWPTPVGGFSYANSSDYVVQDINGNGNTASAGTQIELTFNSNGSHVHKTKDYITGGTGTYNTGGSFSSSGTPTILQARWVIVDGDFTMDGSAADKISVGYVPGGSIASVYQDVRTGTNGDATDLDFSDSWRTITPAVFGGSGSNTQTFSIQATAQSTTSNGDQAKVATNASGDYVGLQLRANSDNSKIVTLRSGLTTNVSISAISYEPPDFTCIMPDMLVIKRITTEEGYTGTWARIGDIVVGDFIAAPADLNNLLEERQWVEVTEARTHTRSGYWDVSGVHITNDHPVWLDHNGNKDWVKVEDMWDGITRSYVEGTVDPVYLGTTPGYYYVAPVDKSGKLIVSGNYAPTTE